MKYFYIIILFITLNLSSSDNFYYNFDEKIDLFSSEYYLGIKTKDSYSIDEIKKLVESLDGIPEIKEIKNIGEKIFLFRFSSKIGDLEKVLKETPFIKYLIKGLHSSINENSWSRFIDKQIIIKFKKNTSLEKIKKILKENNLYLENAKNINKNTFLIAKTDIETDKILNLTNKLQVLPEIEYSHPDFITIYKKFFIPNDRYFSNQWHHKNGYGGVSSIDAWDISRGSKSIKIAIVDDGIDENHEDLDVILSENFSTEAYNLGKDHGTACSGVAAAIGNNEKGMSGICPNCSLISVKLLSKSGAIYSSYKVKAIRFATIMGADVISNSWGTVTAQRISEEFKEVLDFATIEGRKGKGAIVVFATGNDNREIYDYEVVSQDNVIAVGAVNYKDERAIYSNYGEFLDVVAPSSEGDYQSLFHDEGNIWTTDITGNLGYNVDGVFDEYDLDDIDLEGKYTKFFGGTSSATPLVSGMAALILSKAPNLRYKEVIDIIKSTTDKVYGDYDQNGHSKYLGYGKVNVNKAMLKAQELSTCFPDIDGEDCNNRLDDDCDGLIDQMDADCKEYQPCTEYKCQANAHCLYDDSEIELLCVCNEGFTENDEYCIFPEEPCKNIRCSGHGVCEPEGEIPVCNCEQGYHSDGLKCIIDTCADIVCQENAVCDDSDRSCYCEEGYKIEEKKCIEILPPKKKEEGCSYGGNSSFFMFFMFWGVLTLLRKKKPA